MHVYVYYALYDVTKKARRTGDCVLCLSRSAKDRNVARFSMECNRSSLESRSSATKCESASKNNMLIGRFSLVFLRSFSILLFSSPFLVPANGSIKNQKKLFVKNMLDLDLKFKCKCNSKTLQTF